LPFSGKKGKKKGKKKKKIPAKVSDQNPAQPVGVESTLIEKVADDIAQLD
jgi:hypothetical protein